MIINELHKYQDTCNHQVSLMGFKLEDNQIFAFQGFFSFHYFDLKYSKLLSGSYPQWRMILQIRYCLCCCSLKRWWEVPDPIPASSGSQVAIVSSGHKYSEGLPCRLVYASEEGRGHSPSLPDCTNIEMMEWVEGSYVSESLFT